MQYNTILYTGHVNNFVYLAMQQKLPVNGFKWIQYIS